MSEMLITTAILSVLGIGLRVWFVYAATKAIRGPRRSSHQESADYGLSFDERVAKRLAEMPRD